MASKDIYNHKGLGKRRGPWMSIGNINTRMEIFGIKYQVSTGMTDTSWNPYNQNAMLEYVVAWKLHALELPGAYFAYDLI